jgi:hypothetical protein
MESANQFMRQSGVLSHAPLMSKDAAKDWDFTPYAQLVAALLPRAGGLSIFEPDGQLRWTSQETVAPVFEQLIQKSVAVARTTTEAGERTLAGRD